MREGWKSPGGIGGNMIRQFDGFYVPYNPSPPGLGMGMGSDDDGPETALCKGGKFYILNGDFRDRFDELGPQGFDACFAFYKQQNNVSSWSDA